MRIWILCITLLLGCPVPAPDDDDVLDDDDDAEGGGTLQWVHGWGDSASDGGTIVTTSDDDRVFVGGYYWGSADLQDGGPTVFDGSDPGGFVARYTPEGDALWAVTIERPSDYDSDWVVPTHLAATDDGVAVLGLGQGPDRGFAFRSTDPSYNLSVNGKSSWLAWWDDDGDLVRVIMLSRPLRDDEAETQQGPMPCGMVADGEGGVIVALTTPLGLSLLDPDGTETVVYDWEGWPVDNAEADFGLLRFSASGELLWDRPIDHPGGGAAELVRPASIYNAGSCGIDRDDEGVVHLSMYAPTPLELGDGLVVDDVGPAGILAWFDLEDGAPIGYATTTPAAATFDPWSWAVAAAPDGSSYVVGGASADQVFAPGLPEEFEIDSYNGNTDVNRSFVARWDPAGTFDWVRLLSSDTYTPRINDVVARSDGSVCIAGESRGNVVLGLHADTAVTLPQSPENPDEDAFYGCFASNGDVLWGRAVGGWSSFANGISALSDDSLIVTGTHGGGTREDGGPPVHGPGEAGETTVPAGYFDVYVARLGR
jgi:hypothetical protein